MNDKLLPPCAYQGGKQRIAKDIVDIIYKDNTVTNDTKFYDLCCGSGAVSLELVNRGFDPYNIVMVDKSPWGLFWKMIGDTTFSMDLFKIYIDGIPKDITKIKDYVQSIINQPVLDINMVYQFLVLQSCAFGSTATWVENNQWKKAGGLRNYWLPTKTSSRRSHVNPMMPMPNTLYDRVQKLSFCMEGVQGFYSGCDDIYIEPNNIIYIDPPYDKTAKYGYEFDYMAFVERYSKGNIIYLSEGKELSNVAVKISDCRTKGGINGISKKANEEWLNRFETK